MMNMVGSVLINLVFRSQSRALTFPVPELQGISLLDSLVMSAVGAETRQGKRHLAEERELLRNYLIGLGTLLIANCTSSLS